LSCSKPRVRRVFAVATLLLVAWATPTVYAQSEPRAVLEYFEDEFEVEITDADGIPRDVFLGQDLFPGDFIQTFDSTVELRLDPNGTIIKVAPQTAFAIDSIQGREGADRSAFDLSVGRIRAVAARAGGSAYEFRTPFAVGGVRGTDFVLDVAPNSNNAIFVRSGSVEFTNLTTGESILVNEGQGADVFAETFGAAPIPAGQLRSLFDSLEFQALEPLDVNRPEGEPPSDAETADPEPAGTGEEPQASDQSPQATDPRVGNAATDRLLEILRLEAGSVLVDGRTYGKVVFQPEIRRDRFALGFYVPIVYSDNLFDATSWYRPGGNNEWSFGADKDWQANPWGALGDLATDAALKLRYARYREQGDPFFAKVGNLSGITLGHGILVHDYANDWDFPGTRRIGFNLGIDRERNGVELLVNDLLDPALYGARLYYRPFSAPLGFGLSATADLRPASTLPQDEPLYDQTRTTDPILVNVGLDLEFPVVDSERLRLVAFSDIAAPIPYLREDVTDGNGADSGLQTGIVVDPESGELLNFGTMTGVLGSVGRLRFRGDYRTFRGIFRPFYVSGPYDRIRGQLAAETVGYFVDSDADRYDNYGMGFYGEAALSLVRDRLLVRAGYLWPWEVAETGGWQPADDDQLLLEIRAEERLLPIPLSVALRYERRGFVPTLYDRGDYEGAGLFDANTTLRGEVAYRVSPGLSLALTASTALVYTDDGEIAYNDGRPETATTVTVETRIGY
jgi:hypothetical protein